MLIPPVVTTTVNEPAVDGFVENVIVIEVALAAVTSPTAPLFRVTVFFATVVSKPNPLITSVDPLAVKFVVLVVTTGITVATFIAVPLSRVFVVTTAVRSPAVVGEVESVIVSKVSVAVVTVPTASLLNTTVLLRATGSNPKPEIVIVVALAARLALLAVTTGTIVATWIADPLLIPFVVTTAVKGPAVAGNVVNVTERVEAVAESTVPTAPLLNVTVLLEAVVSKPIPLIVSVFMLAVMEFEVSTLTTGTIFAISTAEPLESEFDSTTAVSDPAAVGFVVKVTVSDVADADVTVPSAPLLKVTVLLAAIESNPNPLMVTDVALAATVVELVVTTGKTVAT